MNNIEIEFRAMITKEKYDELERFLSQEAEDLGEDDKDSMFYVVADKIFKVVNETSKQKAKIVLKDKRLGEGNDFKEWEIGISPDEYEKAIDLFNHLNIAEKSVRVWQKRRNYSYQGVEIALKYSDAWKYHIEMEVMAGSEEEKSEAEERIRQVAQALDVRLMTVEEIKEFTEAFEATL